MDKKKVSVGTRIGVGVKDHFQRACAYSGKNVSDVLREMISSFISDVLPSPHYVSFILDPFDEVVRDVNWDGEDVRVLSGELETAISRIEKEFGGRVKSVNVDNQWFDDLTDSVEWANESVVATDCENRVLIDYGHSSREGANASPRFRWEYLKDYLGGYFEE